MGITLFKTMKLRKVSFTGFANLPSGYIDQFYSTQEAGFKSRSSIPGELR
jgi:hypothetical protein